MKRRSTSPALAKARAVAAARAAGARRGVSGGGSRNLKVGAAGYAGARGDRRELTDWWPGVGSADADTLGDLPALRARVRDLARNDPIASGAINTLVTKTIGAGLMPQPRIDRAYLGMTQEQGDEWERAWLRVFYHASKTCDITRKQELPGIFALAFRSELSSGDVLVVRRFKARAGDLLGLKLQLIEADRISNPNGGHDSEKLIAGVQFDDDGAPAWYHVRNGHPGARTAYGTPTLAGETWTAVPAFGLESGTPFALHAFHMERPEQTRGVPLLSPIITQLKQLSRYSEAELMAAVVSAMFTVFVTTERGDGLSSVDEEDDLFSGITPSQARLDTGAIVDLAPGENISTANPGRPNAQFDPFFTAVLRQIGPAIDIPFEVLTKHFTASYSASRAALLELWEGIHVRRSRFVRQIAQPVYVWMMTEAVLHGHIDAPGFFDDPLAFAAYTATEWIGPTAGQLDQLKEVLAAERRVALGVSTLERETALIAGADWEETHAQSVKEKNMRLRDGLGMPGAKLGATEPTPPNTDTGGDDDERRPVEPPPDDLFARTAIAGVLSEAMQNDD